MALSDFVGVQLKRIESAMNRLAHTTMMGDNGVSESNILLNMGKYRQMKAERDVWLAFKKKRDVQESRLEEMPDEPEDDLPDVDGDDGDNGEVRVAARRIPRAKQWGG